MGQID